MSGNSRRGGANDPDSPCRFLPIALRAGPHIIERVPPPA